MSIIVVEDDGTVKKYMRKPSDDDIVDMLDSGYISAVLDMTDDKPITYAKVDWDNHTVSWEHPIDGE